MQVPASTSPSQTVARRGLAIVAWFTLEIIVENALTMGSLYAILGVFKVGLWDQSRGAFALCEIDLVTGRIAWFALVMLVIKFRGEIAVIISSLLSLFCTMGTLALVAPVKLRFFVVGDGIFGRILFHKVFACLITCVLIVAGASILNRLLKKRAAFQN